MAFCSSCGTAVADDVRFCPKCGKEAGAAAGGTPPPQGAPAAAGGMTDNVAGLLCYVAGFVTGIIFLVLEPYNHSPFVRFHAFQSIFYSIACIVLSVGVGMIPFAGFFLSPLLGLAFMVGWVILMVQAFQNKKWKLPVIGDLAEKQS